MTKENILMFISSIEKDYLNWLKENEVAFPTCCFTASEILCSYIQENYGLGEVVLSEKIGSTRRKNVHAQVKVDGMTIDFTYFQFKTWKSSSLKKLNREELYKEIKWFQKQFTFDDSHFVSTQFDNKLIIKPRFNHLAKDAEFSEYLLAVKNSCEFRDYSIFDVVEEENVFWGNSPRL